MGPPESARAARRDAVEADKSCRINVLENLTRKDWNASRVLRALAAGYRACQSPGVHVLHHGFRTWKEGEVLRFSEAQPLASQLR